MCKQLLSEMLTAELSSASVGELIKQINSSNESAADPDVYFKLLPFRIFRIKDHYSEPVPIFGDESWINSTETFPKKYEIIRLLYESEFIKVNLCRNRETYELVKQQWFKALITLILVFLGGGKVHQVTETIKRFEIENKTRSDRPRSFNHPIPEP